VIGFSSRLLQDQYLPYKSIEIWKGKMVYRPRIPVHKIWSFSGMGVRRYGGI
jgi:hypothetical protein